MRKSKRKALLGVLIIVLLVGSIGLFMKNETNTLNNSFINEESIVEELDDNLIGAYIQQGEEYVKADTIPTSGYEFNAEESYCKIGDVVQEEMTLFYDMDTQTLTVSPIAKEGTKCYLYFDEKASAGETILASDNPPTGQTTDWTGGTTYYYTGNPNNWVQFAGFYWRIIRINGDGTIRIIYAGTNYNSIYDDTIGTSAFNNTYNNNMYVGYMYGSNSSNYNTTHANINSSTIKVLLDNWYSTYIENEQSNLHYGQYIDGNAGFCGDRRVSSGNGTGTRMTYYQGYTRVIQNSNPSLNCEDTDIYTTTDSSTGNEALMYPIGLISADEAMFAGIPNSNNDGNTNNYLYIAQYYWTMTPYCYDGSNASVFVVYSRGSLDYGIVFGTDGVRPVINLRANVALSGSGTTSDPFKVAGT